MLKIKTKQTFRKKIRMEQKNKIKSSMKLVKLHKDLRQGVISIYSTKGVNSCEKTIVNIHNGFKKYLKKLSIVWLRPVQIKTTTIKGEKRLGKGKGTVVTHNRCVPIKAGTILFELSYITQLSARRLLKIKQVINSLTKKLPIPVAIKVDKKKIPLITRHTPVLFTPYK